jgi:hypothetical protein
MQEWNVLNWVKVCCGWDLNYANCLRTCHVETVYVYEETMFWMISKCWIKCWICLVLREHDLVITWFFVWYSSEIYTGQSQNIEHTYQQYQYISSISISTVSVAPVHAYHV